jgi:hypothetical protein
MLQRRIALQFGQQLLFQPAHRALPLEEVTNEKQRSSAKTEKRHAQGPLVADGVKKDQRVDERREPACQYQRKHDGKDGELQLPLFKPIQFRAI